MASWESNTGKNMNVASDTNHSGSKNNKKKISSSIDDGNIVVENVERLGIDCKCIKSECKNKRCLCYRFGVGCSLRCGCKSCKNMYGIKDSSSFAKEQEHANDQERDNNDDNGRKNEGTTDNGSSPESHHPVVDNEKKRSSSINDGNGGCNCKKSKCMQLHCECFNAGNFCNDSCSCKNCLNRVENKDYVNETKKEIELRDPWAFEPKTTVVENVARRSKGCICGKIMCMEYYCGCFRYQVGCSLQCRCANCSNPYGTKDSSSVAKEQERANNNDNNGSNNEGTTVNGSSPESHHPVVDDNRLTQEDKKDYYRRQMLLPRENEFHNMPMPSNQVVPVTRKGPAGAAYYYYRVVQNRGDAPHYQPLTPPQISSVRNITEQQNANMLGEPSWQGQSFPRPLRIYYDNSAGPSSVQSSQQYQPQQSYGSHQQVEAPSSAMTWQRLFQPNNNDATNMQARHPHPRLHGHRPSSKFLQ